MLIIEKNVLIFGEGPTKGLDNSTLTAEKEYAINFQQMKACIIIGSIFIYLLTVLKYTHSKQKILKQMQLHCV